MENDLISYDSFDYSCIDFLHDFVDNFLDYFYNACLKFIRCFKHGKKIFFWCLFFNFFTSVIYLFCIFNKITLFNFLLFFILRGVL